MELQNMDLRGGSLQISTEVLGKIARSEELPGEDLYQELLAEDRAREEAQAAEAAAKVAASQAASGVLDEDADAAESVEADTDSAEE